MRLAHRCGRALAGGAWVGTAAAGGLAARHLRLTGWTTAEGAAPVAGALLQHAQTAMVVGLAAGLGGLLLGTALARLGRASASAWRRLAWWIPLVGTAVAFAATTKLVGGDPAVGGTLALGAWCVIGFLCWVAGAGGDGAGAPRPGLSMAAGLLAAALWTTTWSVHQVTALGPKPNIIIVLVDCLRADRLDDHGKGGREPAPNMARLAEQGAAFERAFSTASWTKAAVASLFTGQWPANHGVIRTNDVLAANRTTLAQHLRRRGYTTVGITAGNDWLGPAFGLHRGFGRFHTRFRSGLDAAQLTTRMLAALGQVPKDAPYFAYVHYMDVHTPYSAGPFAGRFTETTGKHPLFQAGNVDQRWVRSALASGRFGRQDRARLAAIYDEQVRFVDDQIGRLLQGLLDRGDLANTIVVVTSDHGEELGEYGNFEHGHTVVDEVARIPLVIAGPGIRPQRVTAPVSLVDIAPTLVAMGGGGGAPPDWDGTDLGPLLAGSGPPPSRPLFATSTLRGPDQHLVVEGARRFMDGGGYSPASWFLVGPQPRLTVRRPAPRLERELDAYRMAQKRRDQPENPAGAGTSGASGPAVDPDTLERLRSLGYAQ